MLSQIRSLKTHHRSRSRCPVQVDDFDDHDRHDPFAIFDQFFMDEIVDKLVEWTNKYTELHPSDDAGEKLQALRDKPLRAPRIYFRCKICQIPFCRKDECWLLYIKRLNSKK